MLQRIFLAGLVMLSAAAAWGADVVTMPSHSALAEIRLMVGAGSADDAAGKPGTANLVGHMLIEGGFGDPHHPVTKEKLAEITRPWGEAALPQVRVDKQVTTFSMRVPRENLREFVAQVLRPMLRQPLFLDAELDRTKRDVLSQIRSGLRFENEEQLGLLALDNDVLAGTPLDHLVLGTVQGVQAVTADDLRAFYKKLYTSGNTGIATTGDAAGLGDVMPPGPSRPAVEIAAPQPIQGRHLTIITQPNAIATGIHFGFPIDLRRGQEDYWPLFLASLHLGLHRDDFGRLYQEIREKRGYNYGDYSYVEYYAERPVFLFPPPTTPRARQYFSVWVRPVAHKYTHFITKAATFELDRFVRDGMTPEQVKAAQVRARTLYLKYADSQSRQLGYRLDDLFYGMGDRGYLTDMLKNIDAVTPQQVNRAIKKYLQAANMQYEIVTNASEGERLADDIANDRNVVTKTLDEYHISTPIPPQKQALLDKDRQWAAYPLQIPRANIRVIPAAEMFEK